MKGMIKLSWAMGVAIFLVSCAGNQDNGVKVAANFANTQHFTVGSPLYYEDQVIGSVKRVEQGEHGAKVTLFIHQEAASLLSSRSAAVVNRLKVGSPIEVYNPSLRNGESLQDGQTIKGLDSMVQLGAWLAGDVIQFGSDTLLGYVHSFQDYLSSPEFEQDSAALQSQLGAAQKSANRALEQIETELESAAKKLTVTEQAAAQAILELGEELTPVVERMADDGARLVAELNEFAESLHKQTSDEQQAGEAFLASLLTTLERLNEALTDGAGGDDDDQGSTPIDPPGGRQNQ